MEVYDHAQPNPGAKVREGNFIINSDVVYWLTVMKQPPPQAFRFSHGRGERETSDW